MNAVLKAQTSMQMDLPTGQLAVQVGAGSMPFDALLGFAARANTKRGFLFLSKVLGKHWPSNPAAMLAVQEDLAGKIPADLPGPILFIAMAETAIGLGQGVFEAWHRRHGASCDALFIHSSRYRLPDAEIFEFAESHSHAPRQFLHLPPDAQMRATFLNAKSLVLIDDEASTGNTFVNLCQTYRQLNPSLQQIHLGVIANFISQQARSELDLGLPYTLSETISAQYQFSAKALPAAQVASIAQMPAQKFDASSDSGAKATFGRAGLSRPLQRPDDLAQKLAAQLDTSAKVLLLGTGEFMHAPFLLALALQAAGVDVVVQSTTRSPILQWGDVACALEFADNYGEGIRNYLYNLKAGQYTDIFLCFETAQTDALQALSKALQSTGSTLHLLHFLAEQEIEEIPVC